jgi:hypothetical protein
LRIFPPALWASSAAYPFRRCDSIPPPLARADRSHAQRRHDGSQARRGLQTALRGRPRVPLAPAGRAPPRGRTPDGWKFAFHALDGGVILLLALALLIISFFAKIPQGVRWAVILLLWTIVQIALGTLSHLFAVIGAVHGAIALALFGVAVRAAMQTRKPAAVPEQPVPAEVA